VAASPVAAGAARSGRRRRRRGAELRYAAGRRGRRVRVRRRGWGWWRLRRLQGVAAATTAAAAAAGTWGGRIPRGSRGCRPPSRPPLKLGARWWRVRGWGAPSAVLPARERMAARGARRGGGGGGGGGGRVARVRTGGGAAVHGCRKTAGARGRGGRGPAVNPQAAGRLWRSPQRTHTPSVRRRPSVALRGAGAVAAVAAAAIPQSSFGGSARCVWWVGNGGGIGTYGGGRVARPLPRHALR